MTRRAACTGILLCGIFLLVVLPLIGASLPDFELNQFFIYRHTENATTKDHIRNLQSAFSLGLRRVFGGMPDNNIDYYDPKIFFDYLFARLPSYAIVYPTETYYYYRTAMADGVTIAGNVRLLDAREGVLHIGYFDANNPHDAKSQSWTADFGEAEGVAVAQVEENQYDVTYKGRTVRFALSDTTHVRPVAVTLQDDETFIAQILDESAIRFFLVYNKTTDSFYYLLNDERGANENLVKRAGGYQLGTRTGFVYYDDAQTARKILVGVAKESIMGNTYYDGPFDQVPPRLPLKEKLEAAYPYVTYRGGIDAHGNFVNSPGSRVAISPYTDYTKLDTLTGYLDRCKQVESNSSRWSCFAYEWKKDFHRSLE